MPPRLYVKFSQFSITSFGATKRVKCADFKPVSLDQGNRVQPFPYSHHKYLDKKSKSITTTMFHPFRNGPKRKVHNSIKKQEDRKLQTPDSSSTPLNVLLQKPADHRRPAQDDSSVDMSIYTTESKTTVQYDSMPYSSSPLKVLLEQDATSKPRKPILDDDSSVDMSIYTTESKTTVQYNRNSACGFDYDWQSESHPIANSTKTKETTHRNEVTPANRPSPSTPSTAPSTPDRQNSPARRSVLKDEPSQVIKTAMKRSGPVDLDEVTSNSSDDSDFGDDSFSSSWVTSSNGMSSPEKKSSDLDTPMIRESPRLHDDEDDENSPYLWTDTEDYHDTAGRTGQRSSPKRMLSNEDTEILKQSYRDTMRSISSKAVPVPFNEVDEDDESCSGVVLLTQEELQKHAKNAQQKEPLPPSSIIGFDKWKEQQYRQNRYVQSLQKENLPAFAASNPYGRSAISLSEDWTECTQEQMDQSMRSTVLAGSNELASKAVMNQPHARRRWKLLPNFQSRSKAKKSGDSPKKMPVAKETMLVNARSKINKSEQLQADESKEQERIQSLKERELKRQREMNLIHARPIRPTTSLSSGLSQVSSLQSQSMVVLTPCIVCDAAERSHIAMPCMHFYFCNSCADKMNATEDTVCPVCSSKNVTFTRVFTG